MLKISPAVIVPNVPGQFAGATNNYILYPDTDDANTFYAMADAPTFIADDKGNPSFNLSWFYGRDMNGGICSMTVGLPMPNMADPAVKAKIMGEINGNQSIKNIAQLTWDLCVAMDAADTTKVQALKTQLGLNDAAAAQKKALWKKTGDWTQFVPDDTIHIKPINYTSGTLLVQGFADQDALDQANPQFKSGLLKTTPSLLNENAAVVTFNLSDLEAGLMWQALGGWPLDADAQPAGYQPGQSGSSFVTVTYQVTFDGMLPEAKAVVTLRHDLIAKLDIETKVSHNAWGRTSIEEKVRGKEYNDAVRNSTEITLPATASPSDKDSVQTLLTDWAAKQLEDMLKAKLPDVSLNDLSLDGARQINEQSDQQRVYLLNQAVSVPKNPQGQLPRVDKLVSVETSKQLFQVIDLNSVPYVKVDLAVAPPNLSELNKRMVDRFVVTQLSYGGQKLSGKDGNDVTSIEYQTSAAQPPGNRYKGTFSKTAKDKHLRYSYLVTYSDGTPSFQSPLSSQPDNNYLDLSSVDIGVLSVKLNAMDLPWYVLSSAQVVLSYDDWEQTVALSDDQAPVMVSKPFGKVMDKTLTYRLKLVLSNGELLESKATSVALKNGRAEITLVSPLGTGSNAISFTLGDGVLKAQLRVEYIFRNSGPDRIFKQLITLDSSKDGGTVDWKVPTESGKGCCLHVTRANVTTADASKTLTNLSGGNVDPVDQQTEITVFADHLESI